MDPVIHFELPVDDMQKAEAFYSTIFGWKITAFPMPDMQYAMATTAPTVGESMMPAEPGAINGAIVSGASYIKAPVIAIKVASVDEYLQKVEQGGGRVVKQAQEIPNMGRYAYASDPAGNVFCLWEILPRQ